jgi:hypothetical protein
MFLVVISCYDRKNNFNHLVIKDQYMSNPNPEDQAKETKSRTEDTSLESVSGTDQVSSEDEDIELTDTGLNRVSGGTERGVGGPGG